MRRDTFEESLIKQGLSADVIRVAMVMTSAHSNATSRDEAISEFCKYSAESMKQEAAHLKWRKFSAEKIKDAKDVSAISSAYRNAPRGSPEEKQAILKWVSLSNTSKEISEAYRETDQGSPEERMALRKWISIATTPEEILEVYWETEDLSEEQGLARDKLIAYFENLVDEYKTASA